MKEQIVEKIRNAGVVGAGGAGFPTHVKVGATVDTVLVNGASCEPLLMSDPWLLEHRIETMIRGLLAVLDCTAAGRGVICLKGKHRQALDAVRQAVSADQSGRLEVFELRDFYPAGDEQVLVREVLGRIVPEAGIPLQVGVVVSNVETLFNVALALDDQPLTERYVTVTGEVRRPMVVCVPVGSLVSDVLAFAGGPTITDYKVVDGGPMMGRVLPDTDQPVTKTTSGLIVLPPDHNVVARKIMDPERVRRITNTICCQCSQCTDLCPRNLLGHRLYPHKLMRIWNSRELTDPSAQQALLCSECGICEKFACPMQVSPREVNAQIKRALMGQGVRWQPADCPPREHPFRQTRSVPTSRLMHRLDVIRYDTHPGLVEGFRPSVVVIPLKQHIGAPAVCQVRPGDRVGKGDLIGEIPDQALGARVHASINGVVESVADGNVTIRA
jgi:RnfABCDGE-type electron transport complex C subunit